MDNTCCFCLIVEKVTNTAAIFFQVCISCYLDSWLWRNQEKARKKSIFFLLNSNPPVQMGSSPLHCRSPWQRRMVTSKPLGNVNPGLQRTSSRAEKDWVGERRRATEFSPGGRGQGQVRPEEKREERKREIREQKNSQIVPGCSSYKTNNNG